MWASKKIKDVNKPVKKNEIEWFPDDKETDLINENLEKLKKFRKVGEIFTYCGIKMIVEQIAKTNFYNMYWYAEMTAAYKNNAGELKHTSFRVDQLPALYAEDDFPKIEINIFKRP